MNKTMRIRKMQFFWGVSLFVISAIGAVGCAKTGSSYSTSPVSYVSVLNEAPYGPASADIYLNNQLANTSSIPSGLYSNKYGPVQPGTYRIDFKKGGADSLLSSIAGGARQILDTLNFYTLVLYNDSTTHRIQSMLIHDDFSSISTTNANYRFFNLSPDATNVDFYLNGGSTPTFAYRQTGDNAAPSSSYNTFVSTAPSTYSFVVKVAGDTALVTSLNNQNLTGGNVYTIFLTGVKGAYKLNVLPASY